MAKYQMKQCALTSKENSLQIITDVTKTIFDRDAAFLSSSKFFIDHMQVINKKLENFRPLYDDIPIKYQQDLQNNKFMIEGSGINDTNSVLFFF